MAKEPPKTKPPQKKKGFSVGPANLPDGTYKRKVDKIKKTLIHKAKVKKTFFKQTSTTSTAEDPHAARARALFEEAERLKQEAAEARRQSPNSKDPSEPQRSKTEIHPERQAALSKPEEPIPEEPQSRPRGRPQRKPKTSAYKKEEDLAAKLKAEREAAAKELEEKERIRKQKEVERSKRKKVMNSRTRTGQQKLGKQSLLLLDKVKSQMGAK
ncbi:hypothetical protein RUND412_010569 [Rhizina undulata]